MIDALPNNTNILEKFLSKVNKIQKFYDDTSDLKWKKKSFSPSYNVICVSIAIENLIKLHWQSQNIQNIISI